ncbi:hypothetical protein Q9L58_002966 [Maublancomyces gigas]|uniref:STAS domain-containing protein n=1 Tax=Discina gigas TaxID=1032678 RepID=A0ABR3GQ35_9PEZI
MADSSAPVSGSSKVGRALASFLQIDLTPANLARNPPHANNQGRAESVLESDSFVETEPTVIEWVGEFKPTGSGFAEYLLGLFPFVSWIHRYNLKWLYGDLVAGITVGCVVIPQGMAYAKLANLPVEFGLYSSFVGVMIYWFFATSKDITIGPVAVMSTLVGNIVIASPHLSGQAIASGLALIAGSIVTLLGLLRLGFVVEYIPLTAIAAFMTGSAISIAAGQVANLMGMTGFNTRGPTYLVIINSFKHLPSTKLDAAMGLSALFLLYLLRWFTTSFLSKKYPLQKKTWFFLATLRTAFVLLLFTLISFLVNRGHKKPIFKILQTVPSGFRHMGVPVIDREIIASFQSELPATVIVMLIEHIAISKSFGRINNYTINPSQEMIAIGITNIIGPFFGGYPATGSFSRTAIKSKAGVRTPFAGVITGIVVLLAIYLLTAVFYYIPNSSLSAVIIHAVGDLITPPNTVYKFWLVSPLEVFIFFAGVFVTIFTSIENGIYVTVAASAVVLLFRTAKAQGNFLGRVKIHSVVGDQLIVDDSSRYLDNKAPSESSKRSSAIGSDSSRNVFLPLDRRDGSNPGIEVVSPYPGVFIYRFSEGFIYANATHYTEYLVAHIFESTRATTPQHHADAGDRAWNDAGPKRGQVGHADSGADTRPLLRSIILDFSSVNNVDITSVQNLIDVRNQLDRYAAPDKVEWHFAAVNNRWTKRALAAAGFGYPTEDRSAGGKNWTPVFSVAHIAESEVAIDTREKQGLDEEAGKPLTGRDSEDVHPVRTAVAGPRRRVVGSVLRPFFHPDIDGALQSAIRSIEDR